jgi:FMN phosphatase YigB (HAD superfamily)
VANLSVPEPAGGAPDRPTRAVLFDALGTLVELEPPWIGLKEALGDDVDDARLVRAVKEEMAFYKQHANEGRDAESLADLRARSAEVLSRGLGQEVPVHVLVDAIRFGPYPDAVPALSGVRERGLRLICVSNWDISLRDVLERCGLMEHLDGAVSSAEAAAPKPDPALLLAGCELVECGPEEALMVGDTPDEDTAAAQAAGMRSLLIDRTGAGDISSLGEVVAHV